MNKEHFAQLPLPQSHTGHVVIAVVASICSGEAPSTAVCSPSHVLMLWFELGGFPAVQCLCACGPRGVTEAQTVVKKNKASCMCVTPLCLVLCCRLILEMSLNPLTAETKNLYASAHTLVVCVLSSTWLGRLGPRLPLKLSSDLPTLQ